MSWILDGRPLERVLVTRLRYLGDIAMSTVVLQVLRRGDPTLELGYLCEAHHAPLLADHPLLTRVHALAVTRRGADAGARVAAVTATAPAVRGTLRTVLELRRHRYQLAVDLFFNPRSAWLLRLAGIPARIGGTASPSRRRLYTHQALSPDPSVRPDLYRLAGGGLGEHLSRLMPLQHSDGRSFREWFTATYALGGPRTLVRRPGPDESLRTAMASLGVSGGGAMVLAPGATWPSKEWPATHWCDLAAALTAAGHKVLVLSPPGGDDRFAAVARAIPTGAGGVLSPLSLPAALAVVGTASRLVGADGGIVHAAVAMGIPTLALFGPTDPWIWFPYEQLGPFRVIALAPPCHPCHLHECNTFVCLPRLTPAQVLAALEDLPFGGDDR